MQRNHQAQRSLFMVFLSTGTKLAEKLKPFVYGARNHAEQVCVCGLFCIFIQYF